MKLHRITGTLFPERKLKNWAMYLTLVDQKLQEVGVHSLTKEQLKRVCPYKETKKSYIGFLNLFLFSRCIPVQ